MTNHVQVTTNQRIVHIELNRPEKKNALTQAMYTAISDALSMAELDPAVRVILLSGAGNAFTAGNDIMDFIATPPTGEESPVFHFLRTISQAKKPIVAAVQGVAIGIGTTMLLHCDLVYAGQGARFQLPFVNLGLAPEGGSSLLLPQILGQRKAAELLLLGEMFDAQRALESGFVTRVVADGDLLQTAMDVAAQLAAKPPMAMRFSKRLMKQHGEDALQNALSAEGKIFAELLASPEAAEALQAFLEKRKPDFSKFES